MTSPTRAIKENTPPPLCPNSHEPKNSDIEASGLDQEKFDAIICPNLRIGVRMGLLNPGDEAWVCAK